MTSVNKDLAVRLFHDADRTERAPRAIIADGFRAHIGGGPPMDLESFEGFLAGFYSAFSDYVHEFDALVEEGDFVAFRATASMTHTGEFMGVAPTGKRVRVAQVGMVRVRDGKVAELWNMPDRAGLMSQLGIVPAGV